MTKTKVLTLMQFSMDVDIVHVTKTTYRLTEEENR